MSLGLELPPGRFSVGCGLAGCATVRSGLVRSDEVWFGQVRNCLRAGLRWGQMWFGTVRSGGVRLGLVW